MADDILLRASDGVGLRVRIAGEGRPVLMLHGFLADAERNWMGPGVSDALVAKGRRVIMPDLRGHGGSDKPIDPAHWPPDILVQDGLDLIRSLHLTDYDLLGYSLGARTAARMMVRGAQPRLAVLGGMGASGVMQAGARADMFEDAIRHGAAARDPKSGRRIQRMIQDAGLEPQALLGVLASFVETTAAELAAIRVACLILCGRDDADNGSPEALAALLPNAKVQRIPGDHLSAVVEPAFIEAIAAFLAP